MNLNPMIHFGTTVGVRRGSNASPRIHFPPLALQADLSKEFVGPDSDEFLAP